MINKELYPITNISIWNWSTLYIWFLLCWLKFLTSYKKLKLTCIKLSAKYSEKYAKTTIKANSMDLLILIKIIFTLQARNLKEVTGKTVSDWWMIFPSSIDIITEKFLNNILKLEWKKPLLRVIFSHLKQFMILWVSMN